MINRIKGLVESEKRILELAESSKENSVIGNENKQLITELKEEMMSLKKGFSYLQNESDSTTTQLKKDITALKELKDNLRSEITDFKLLKTALKKQLVEELITEFRSELGTHCERLKTDVKSYNDLKTDLQAMRIMIDETKNHFVKFNSISKGIKETDFQLSSYITKITEMDREKLRLMKRVDDMQRLIAKERRSR